MSLQSKYLKKLPEGFFDGMQSADTEELKSKILESERHIYEIEQEKEENEKLKAIKEEAKILGSSFRDAKNTEEAKIKYCLYLLEERGVKI